MKRWTLIALILAIAVGSFFVGRGTKPVEVITKTVEVPVEKIVEKTITVEVPVKCEACAPVAAEPVKVPDTVAHFYDLATFYVDGDPDVQGYKVQGATMKYTCKNDFGVFVTMDPGVVNGQSTGDLGAVFYVACKIGDVITLSTPHWSASALHQQIHLVEFTQEISEKQAAEFLKILKIDEGKEISFFIDSTGKVTKY